MELYKTKQKLRENIALQKKEYTKDLLCNLSCEILKRLEGMDIFLQSSCIGLYYELPGEVQTSDFIEKWKNEKHILLPVVSGNDLSFMPYNNREDLIPNSLGVLEPSYTINIPKVEEKMDLIIVPGIAFDRSRNRMGRGKGYYDRFLQKTTANKVGICFGFQLFDEIPTESFDIKMDVIITENEIIR